MACRTSARERIALLIPSLLQRMCRALRLALSTVSCHAPDMQTSPLSRINRVGAVCGALFISSLVVSAFFPSPGLLAQSAPASAASNLKVARAFKADLLYSVPKETEGSWVAMCVDPKGRLIVSDQYGTLYRIVPTH